MTPQTNLVLMIEDEEAPNIYYIRALERAGYTVELRPDPASALDFARQHRDEISIILLDVMMPPGSAYSREETEDGMRTGLLVYRDLQHSNCCDKVPVIILTSVRHDDALPLEDRPGLTVVQKIHCTPRQLVERVNTMLGSSEKGGTPA